MTDTKKLTPKEQVLAIYPNATAVRLDPLPDGTATWVVQTNETIHGENGSAAGAWQNAAQNIRRDLAPSAEPDVQVQRKLTFEEGQAAVKRFEETYPEVMNAAKRMGFREPTAPKPNTWRNVKYRPGKQPNPNFDGGRPIGWNGRLTRTSFPLFSGPAKRAVTIQAFKSTYRPLPPGNVASLPCKRK